MEREKIWKKILKTIWMSEKNTTVREISLETGLSESQIHNSLTWLKAQRLIKSEKKWKIIWGIPRSQKIIMINDKNEKGVRKALENG